MLPTTTLNSILVLYDGREEEARAISEAIGQAGGSMERGVTTEAISGAGDGSAGDGPVDAVDGGAATPVNDVTAAATVSLVDISGVQLRDCCGCFGCWIRTPGLCLLTGDKGNALCGQVMEARAVIFVSRITWGGYSAAVKTVADRMLPLLHPDFARVNGAMHHRMRYSRMPRLLAVGYGAASAAEEETFLRYTEAHGVNFGVVKRTDDSTEPTTIWRGDAGAFHAWLTAWISLSGRITGSLSGQTTGQTTESNSIAGGVPA